MTGMTTKRIGFVVLVLWVQRVANETVTGIIGSSVNLSCPYPKEDRFVLNDFRIQWQKKDESHCYIDAYLPGEKKANQCEDFKNRTSFSGRLEQGDFTLRLSHIGLKDEFTYICIVQKKKNGMFERISQSSSVLKVAANYSKPVLTRSVKPEGEMTIICNSSGGYPRQKIYWLNRTDNSLLNATEEFTREPDGMFTVSSRLTIRASSDAQLECIVENEQLHQKLTATIDMSSVTSSLISHSPSMIWTPTVVGIVIFLSWWNNIY